MADQKRTKRWFLIGTFATLLVFAVFYLRNTDVVVDYWKEYKVFPALGGLLCLAIVAAGGGVWTYLSNPRSHINAFSIGLAAPAVIFAADLGGADPASTPSPAPSAAVSTAGTTPAIPSTTDEKKGFSFTRIVFAPLSSVALAERRLAETEFEVEREQFRHATQQLEQVQIDLETERGRAAKLRDSLRVQNEQFRADLEELRVKIDGLPELSGTPERLRLEVNTISDTLSERIRGIPPSFAPAP